MWTLFLLSIYIHQDMQANKQANKWARKTISSFFWLESINIDKLSIFNQQWKPIRWETYVKETYFIINFMYKYSNMQDFLLFFFKEKKNRDRQREILLQRSELCRGDTREMCLDGLLLGPGGAAKSTCTTYDQKLRMMYRQTQCTEAIEKRNKRRKTGIESTDRMHTLCLVLGLISSLVWEREAAGLLAV